MTLGWRLTLLGAMVTAAVSLVSAQSARPVADRPPLAEDVFKNLQVLKGIPVNQFMETMGFFSASLGADCTFCHVTESGGSWEKYADDNQHKRTARGMVRMVSAINQNNFAGKQVVTCFTCHRGGDRPKVTPSLALLYGAAPPDEQDDTLTPAGAGAPAATQVLERYVGAVGGSKWSTITSFAATGTYEAYTDRAKHPVELFAKAPGQRTTIVHAPDGNITSACDGLSAWLASPLNERPVPVLALAGGDLDAARLEAQLSFPGRIARVFTRWQVGAPATIDDRSVDVVQGSSAGKAPATFFFDKGTGLLVRLVRYADSVAGRIPMQTDYSDYRDVSGVKMPFKWTSTWLDGRSTIELSDVRVNVPVQPAAFTRPVAK